MFVNVNVARFPRDEGERQPISLGISRSAFRNAFVKIDPNLENTPVSGSEDMKLVVFKDAEGGASYMNKIQQSTKTTARWVSFNSHHTIVACTVKGRYSRSTITAVLISVEIRS